MKPFLLKNFIGILIVLLFAVTTNAQTVIEMTYPTDADIVLVKVDNKKDADIVVYRTEDKEEAKQWDCMWKFKEWGFSDFSIFVMNNISDTILYMEDDYAYKVAGKIYFTDKKEERGYNDPFFRLEGVFRKFRETPSDSVLVNNNTTNSLEQSNQIYRILVNGNVTVENNSNPKNIVVKILDSLTINTLYEFKTESTDFIINKEVKKGSYYIMITADGYKPFKELIESEVSLETGSEKKQNLRVKLFPIDVPKVETIKIVNNILFYYDRYYLKPEAKVVLDKISKILISNPNLKLEITGYTDALGKDDYNLNLSKLRSKSVVNYLLKKGISPERLISKGNGKNNPIAINKNPNGSDSPQGRKYNRRVELKFINDDGNIIIENIVVPDSLKINSSQQ